MKQAIANLLTESLKKVEEEQSLTLSIPDHIQVENSRDKQHGDYASNIAMILAKQAKMTPRQLAELILKNTTDSSVIEKIEIAGPGFINFYLKQNAQSSIVEDILKSGNSYGQSNSFAGKKALIEFVSANPTGPLHVGHGRGAAYGAVVANLLQAIGYEVNKEYYVNDAGRQMDILAASVYLRYLEENNHKIRFPDKAYQGDYIYDIARNLKQQHEDSLFHPIELNDNEDPEKQLDALIDEIKTKLGDDYNTVHQAGLDTILRDIKNDLAEFGVPIDNWFSERSLSEEDQISKTLKQLEGNGHIYAKDGAKWFRSETLGDEKDRVIIRDNGQSTYFASDIAYHDHKFKRGYDKIIDIWGADHHGYIARVRAALEALGHDNDKLDVLLVQFVSLYRGKEKMQMSTRSGQFVTLSELREEVGKDATRFFYVMRKSEQHLDFDLELAKSSKKENPVFYIQYAHARICRLQEKLKQQDPSFDWQKAITNLDQLSVDKEQQLLSKLSAYKETIEKAAIKHEPHLLVYYLKELSTDFHTYYDTHRIMDVADNLKMARICLCLAVKQVICNGLTLLGVSAPESM